MNLTPCRAPLRARQEGELVVVTGPGFDLAMTPEAVLASLGALQLAAERVLREGAESDTSPSHSPLDY